MARRHDRDRLTDQIRHHLIVLRDYLGLSNADWARATVLVPEATLTAFVNGDDVPLDTLDEIARGVHGSLLDALNACLPLPPPLSPPVASMVERYMRLDSLDQVVFDDLLHNWPVYQPFIRGLIRTPAIHDLVHDRFLREHPDAAAAARARQKAPKQP